eukprot:1159490-Pelagomonas_calceolata.AAC.6
MGQCKSTAPLPCALLIPRTFQACHPPCQQIKPSVNKVQLLGCLVNSRLVCPDSNIQNSKMHGAAARCAGKGILAMNHGCSVWHYCVT